MRRMAIGTFANHDKRGERREWEGAAARPRQVSSANTVVAPEVQSPTGGPSGGERHWLRAQMARLYNSTALRFLLLGAFSFSCNLAIPAILHEVFGIKATEAFAAALVTVFITNFYASRKLVFPGIHRSVTSQGAMFLFSSLGFRGSEYLGFLWLHLYLRMPYLLAITLILTVSFTVKYVFYKNVVFRPLAP
jgi:putative flippase GtrA